jgi:hypothetical protein
MSTWKDVGAWLSRNGKEGTNLVGSLLTGNIPGAVASAVSWVSGATGYSDPEKALESLQAPNSPALVRLKELSLQNEASIRGHIFEMEKIRLEDEQAQHKETQETIRAGDKADDKFVRWTRPGMSWCALGLAAAYVINIPDANEMIFYGIMTLPYSYMGLREFGKWAQLQSKEKK